LASDDLDGVCRALYNSLEAPSVRKFPVLQLLKDAMRDGGASGALMSGSGATVFGLFAEKSAAETCAAAMREEFGPSMWTCVTRCRGME
jgi:4-diphosphocytidyl-2-C-methyl-D-erythritol kinase